MSPRVTYWTGIWDPCREAISKEVQMLRSALQPGAPVVSFSAGQRSAAWPRDGVVRLSGRRWLLLRAIATALEPRGELTHAFGTMNDWHLLRSLGRRPLVFTVVAHGAPSDRSLYDKVSMFVAETEPLAAALRRAGVPGERIRIIPPGLHLDHFTPAPPPVSPPFRILFASSPASPLEFEARGIPLLVELARACPDVEIVLLWRQWGNPTAARQALASLRPPSNVRVEAEAADMVALYQGSHATVCCYADGFGKSCPNSVIEGLACGRPAIVTEGSGLAHLIRQRSAGVVASRTVSGMAAAVEQLRSAYATSAIASRRLAEDVFAHEGFQRAYRTLYDEVGRRRDLRPKPVEKSPAGRAPRRFRLAAFPHRSGPGGNPYIDLFYQALRAEGIESEALVVNDDWLCARARRLDGIHLHWPEGIWRARGPSAAARLRGVAGLWRYLRLARQLGLKRVCTLHNLQPHEAPGWIDRLGYRAVLSECDLLICHSQEACDAVKAHSTSRGNVVLMRIGNYDGVYPPPRPRAEVLSALGLSADRPVMSCVGTLRDYKGLNVACDAAELLEDRVQLIVAGEPHPRFAVEPLRRRLGARGGAVLLDTLLSHGDFADLTAASDIVLLPYLRVTGSSAALAALTFGRPVVASDLPYFRELLEAEPDAGALVPVRDAPALAQAVTMMLETPVARRTAAALRLARVYSWDRCAQPVVRAIRVWID